MKSIGESIKKYRKLKQLTQAELAKQLRHKFGLKTDRAMVSKWETGYQIPEMFTITCLANLLGITIEQLNGSGIQTQHIKDLEGTLPSEKCIYFEVIGSVKAGYGGEAIEERTGEIVPIPKSMLGNYPPNDFFALKVKGDSMYPKIIDGDIVLVYRTSTVDSETIAVVIYNGDEATVKKIRYVIGENWFEMIPINPEYQTKRIKDEDLKECRVLGKVVKLIRDL